MATVSIDEEDLRKLLVERNHLREQVTALQDTGTKLVEQLRKAKRALREYGLAGPA